MKILLVDDNESLYLLVAVWLARAGGFNFQFARDGDDALRRVAERGPFDVVLTDYCHCGPDGLRSCGDLNIPIRWKPSDGQHVPRIHYHGAGQ